MVQRATPVHVRGCSNTDRNRTKVLITSVTCSQPVWWALSVSHPHSLPPSLEIARSRDNARLVAQVHVMDNLLVRIHVIIVMIR